MIETSSRSSRMQHARTSSRSKTIKPFDRVEYLQIVVRPLLLPVSNAVISVKVDTKLEQDVNNAVVMVDIFKHVVAVSVGTLAVDKDRRQD